MVISWFLFFYLPFVFGSSLSTAIIIEVVIEKIPGVYRWLPTV